MKQTDKLAEEMIGNMSVVTPNSNVRKIVSEHPELKEFLVSLSPKFKKLKNPLIFNTLARKASFADIAEIGGIPLEELLVKVNSFLGNEYVPPNLGHDVSGEEEARPEWMNKIRFSLTVDVRNRDDFFFTELINKLQSLAVGQALVVINDFDPRPLREEAKKLGVESFSESLEDGSVKTTFYRVKVVKRSVDEKKEYLPHEIVDLSYLERDVFEYVLDIARHAKKGNTITVYHKYEDFALTKLLISKGFSFEREWDKEKKMFRSVFTRVNEDAGKGKVKMVLQSATPFLYPFFVRLVQSDELLAVVDFDMIKVWEETEKHLAWVNRGIADISLSAVMVSAKFAANRKDVKLLSVDVWNNFYLLVRGAKPKDLTELPEKQIVMPLFEKAPPASITSYLLKKSGLRREDFDFIYGSGSSKMGRPNDIERGFVEGWFNQVLLRQPEASFTLFGLKDVHVLSYGELWKKFHPNSIGLPNAGVLVKGSFLKKHPEIVDLFVKELVSSAEWVKKNSKEAALMTAEFMKHSPEEVELFIKNADIRHVPVEEAYEDLLRYYQVLIDSGVLLLRASLEETMQRLMPEEIHKEKPLEASGP